MNRFYSLFIPFILFFIGIFTSQAAIINVPADQPTIQAAVNAASAGDEIIVANGTYNESVNINTMGTPGNITVRAANAGMATVNGGTGAPFSAATFSGDITIDGFEVDRDVCSCNDDGVLDFRNVTGLVTLKNNVFDGDHGNNSIYILADGTTSMEVVADNNSGVIVIGCDNADFFLAETGGSATLDATVINNVFSGLEDDGIAFHIDGTSTVSVNVKDNDFSTYNASGGGIEFFTGKSGSTGATLEGVVEGNRISNITSGDGILIDIHGSNTALFLTIKNNTLTGVNNEGIEMNTQSNATGASVELILENNILVNNRGRGIYVEAECKAVNPANSYQVRIENNDITSLQNNPAIGVYTDDTDDNYSLCLEMFGNTVNMPLGSSYEVIQANGSTVTLEQGISASTVAATVIGDNNNIGTPIVVNGTINVVAGACMFTPPPGSTPVYPISLITTDSNNDGLGDSIGVFCQIQGVVHGVDLHAGTGFEFTIIDATGGMGVFSADEYGYTLTEGDEVMVRGTVDHFNGLTEIMPVDTLKFVSSGNPLQAPTVITQPTEATEAEMIKAECFKIIDPTQWMTGGGSGFFVSVTNNADTFPIFIDDQVDLFMDPAPTGHWFDFTGIGGQFDDPPYVAGYYLLPRYRTDVVTLPDPTVGFDKMADTVAESGGMINVSLSQINGNPDITQITVELALATSSATEGSDFTFSTMTFDLTGKGTSSDNFDVPIIQDTDVEGDETIRLSFSTVTNHAVTSIGTIQIVITDDDAGAIDVLAADAISMFPNPGINQMVLESSVNMDAVTVTNMLGQEVIQVFPSSFETMINTKDFVSGTYLVRAITREGVWVQKWVKE